MDLKSIGDFVKKIDEYILLAISTLLVVLIISLCNYYNIFSSLDAFKGLTLGTVGGISAIIIVYFFIKKIVDFIHKKIKKKNTFIYFKERLLTLNADEEKVLALLKNGRSLVGKNDVGLYYVRVINDLIENKFIEDNRTNGTYSTCQKGNNEEFQGIYCNYTIDYKDYIKEMNK